MIYIGPISSIYDFLTFYALLKIFHASEALFHTGWFVESLMTQTLIIHVIRTNLIPFIQSRASWQLTLTTVVIMGFSAYLPYSPLATSLGFVPLPPLYWPLLLLTLICYVGLTQVVKTWLIRKSWV